MTPRIPDRWSHPLALGLTVLGLVFAARNFYEFTRPEWHQLLGLDRGIYHDAALRWLQGDVFYLPEQVAGPYVIRQGHVLYPPTALIWLAPAALLPDVLWFGLPPLIVGAVILWHRPLPWTWPLLAALFASTDTAQMFLSGTPTTWVAIFVAVGTIWRPAYALVFLKPSLAPFALLGVRNRGWWAVALAMGAISLAMLPMWLDYFKVIGDARGHLATPFYSLKDAPLIMLPIVAWAGGRRRRAASGVPLRPQASSRAGAILRA